ncbi:hypothetical protein F5Y16DRAFT_384748 [Xylariaceae sp. FL0255]|nr:hypothetical protein F5Y16DRAFT_384748 [Xylariaceae sp. FL0255]
MGRQGGGQLMTPDEKGRDEAAESLLSLSDNNTSTAANAPVPDDFSSTKPELLDSYTDSGEEPTGSQRVPAKRPRFDDTYKSRKRAKSLGDLILTISAVHVRRGDVHAEAFEYNPDDGVWTDLDGVEYDFDHDKFTAARVAFGISHQSPYWWRFQSHVKN